MLDYPLVIQGFRKEGFEHQELVVLPGPIQEAARRHPVLRSLHVTDAGFFPDAVAHGIERKRGASRAVLIVCLAGRGWVDLGSGARFPFHLYRAMIEEFESSGNQRGMICGRGGYTGCQRFGYRVFDGLVPDFATPEARKIFLDLHEKSLFSIGFQGGLKLDECDHQPYSNTPWSFPEASRFPPAG